MVCTMYFRRMFRGQSVVRTPRDASPEVQRMTLMPEFGANMEGLLGGFRTSASLARGGVATCKHRHFPAD